MRRRAGMRAHQRVKHVRPFALLRLGQCRFMRIMHMVHVHRENRARRPAIRCLVAFGSVVVRGIHVGEQRIAAFGWHHVGVEE